MAKHMMKKLLNTQIITDRNEEKVMLSYGLCLGITSFWILRLIRVGLAGPIIEKQNGNNFEICTVSLQCTIQVPSIHLFLLT
jgi:hypothetical protein